MESNCPWKKETIPQIGWAPLWNQHSTSYGWGAVSLEVISLASRRQARQNYTGNRGSPWTSSAFPVTITFYSWCCGHGAGVGEFRGFGAHWIFHNCGHKLYFKRSLDVTTTSRCQGYNTSYTTCMPVLQHLCTAMCFVSKLPLHTLSHTHTWCCC